MKYTVENITKGPKGFHDKVSGLVMLNGGAKATDVEFGPGEKDATEDSGYFKVTGGKAKDAEPVAEKEAEKAEGEVDASPAKPAKK